MPSTVRLQQGNHCGWESASMNRETASNTGSRGRGLLPPDLAMDGEEREVDSMVARGGLPWSSRRGCWWSTGKKAVMWTPVADASYSGSREAWRYGQHATLFPTGVVSGCREESTKEGRSLGGVVMCWCRPR